MTLRAGQKIREGDFIKKSERNGTLSNDVDKVPRLESDGYLDADFIKFSISLPSMVPIDGSVTPKPVTSHSAGTLVESDANGGTEFQRFLGFLKENVAGLKPTFLVADSVAGANQSITIPAGNNVVLLVGVNEYSAGSLPSGYTFNGVALTASVSIVNNSTASMQLWWVALGNIASPLTANLVRTGGSISGQVALVYSNTHQTTPFQATPTTAINGADPALTGTLPYSTVVCFAGGGNPVSIGNAGYTNRGGNGDMGRAGEFNVLGNPTVVFGDNGAATNLITFMLNTVGTMPEGKIQYGGIVSGFSGLTRNRIVYVSDTSGAVSHTPGTNSIPVGVAVSVTEILMFTKL